MAPTGIHQVSGKNPVFASNIPYINMDYIRRLTKNNETHTNPCPGNAYLRQALGHDLLTAQEEAELGRKALSGDIDARNALVLYNQRFLLKLVGEFHTRHQNLEYDDLISEANLGLMRAAEKYDTSTGNRFITYARFWILQALGRFSNQESLPVRLPEHRAEELKKLRSAAFETGMTDPAGLSLTTGIDEETVRTLLPYIQGTASLDAPVCTPSGDEGETLGNLVCPVEVDFLQPIRDSELMEVLQRLPERHRDVLMHRYGVFGHRKMTLQEIADSYGITRERVRQIESKALSMCRSLGKHIA